MDDPASGHGYEGPFTEKEFLERAADHDKAARNGLSAGPNISYVRTFQACAHALRLAAPLLTPSDKPEREDGVDEILSKYTKMINSTPMLLSLLYDINMLPEQTVTRAGAIRMAGLCEVWTMYEKEKAKNNG